MTTTDSKEARRVAALKRIFSEPEKVAARYKRKSALFLVAAIGIALIAGFLGKHEASKDLSVALMLLSGIVIGLGITYRASAREVVVLARYCTLKNE